MTERIETHTTLEGFFGELVREALEAERLVLDEACVTYLLNLLDEFAHHDALFGAERPGEPGTPALVWLYQRAQTAERGVRFQAYRHLGDVSLVVSGLFSPHIERTRSLVGLDYYVQMGACAYESAATLADRSGFGRLLAELSQKFRRVVEVLTRVAERTTLPVPNDVLALYERYARNPESAHLARRLVEERMIPCFAGQGVRN